MRGIFTIAFLSMAFVFGCSISLKFIPWIILSGLLACAFLVGLLLSSENKKRE
jgi:hypothetical protein